MLIYLLGKGGSGKTEAASYLASRGFVSIALADPLKRYCAELYDFSYEQLWGKSASRNAIDQRFPREEHGPVVNEICVCCGQHASSEHCFLTPRFALQSLSVARSCFATTMIHYLFRVLQSLTDPQARYSPQRGVFHETSQTAPVQNVVVPDVRFENEHLALRDYGGLGIRIERDIELPDGFKDHSSEQEQSLIQSCELKAVIQNSSTRQELYCQLENFLSTYAA